MTNLPPSCADCHEILEPQPPGTLRACPGLYKYGFTITVFKKKKSDRRLGFWASVASRFVNDDLVRFWNKAAVLLTPYLPKGTGGNKYSNVQ
jgi:hypothetical protein